VFSLTVVVPETFSGEIRSGKFCRSLAVPMSLSGSSYGVLGSSPSLSVWPPPSKATPNRLLEKIELPRIRSPVASGRR
jgi:hypothetical protein